MGARVFTVTMGMYAVTIAFLWEKSWRLENTFVLGVDRNFFEDDKKGTLYFPQVREECSGLSAKLLPNRGVF